MKLYPAIILMLALWLLMTAVLPAWLDVRFIPNLVLAGALVLAVANPDQRGLLVVAVLGLILDMQGSLVIGSFTIGLCLLYASVQALFRRFVPADRVYLALPLTFIASHILLGLWIFVIGLAASNAQWPVQPQFAVHATPAYLVTLLIGAVLTLGIYLLWLEVMQRAERPLRLHR
jgi:hypothetical protein